MTNVIWKMENENNSKSLRVRLKPRRSGSARRVPGVRAFDFQLAFINFVTARGEERVKVFAAESQVGDFAVRRRNYRVDTACLVANLNAHPCGDVKSPFAIDAHAVRAAVVRVVRDMQPVITLFVSQ